ncbi:hypothetical protein LTT66_11370 [Nocardia gipuzkoensis]|uniref:hypothetical protein n=1 Tax=Nocardia gipuzkoensis TaxID=2749991 RepID=UPI001E5E60A2|nr:hypothetical protein [Nocardia gipuzkoensis]UGT70713.1 hypothetical protein LTT66_11370 [Nocardia gipuzkoensis]
MRPTPWQNRAARDEQVDSAGGVARRRWADARRRAALGRRRLAIVLGGNWVHLSAAVGCIITLVLLFQPWLTTGTGGTDGVIHANAFGRIHVTTFWVDLWAQASVPSPKASGTWGILTSVAIVIAVGSMAVDSVARTEAFAYLAIVATVLVAIFTIATVLYLNSKGDELTRVVSYGTARDPGTQVGLLIRWARGHDDYPAPGFRPVSYATYSLTRSAMFAVGISLLSALAVVAQWMHGRRDHPRLQRLELGDRNA